ncbi:hypothetical protein [Allosphingosinicella indica]|uniref:Ribbon-helix-helix protein, CopG family n=1 Tax=Allosphingosinicella indica TaxID=941907 RepID=A0A1X7GAV8_9SPHN|nr:hypothetical protein [Allosphingosinicella indica]SMF66227.1 hypothetical protein SAMN06295910_1377 [Allosphingosinicella indica]
MQTERVTFLTTPDQKAALDAFASSNGMSVGHVVREAANRYISEGAGDDEAALAALIDEVNDAVPRMRADLQQSIAAIRAANARVDAILSDEGVRRL